MAGRARAAVDVPTVLRAGDRVVFFGDSITEQRMYTNYVENYLVLRYPRLKLSFVNAGWAGDTTVGGLKRLDRDVLSVKPTVVVICYGMNDGGYGYAKPADVAAKFRANLLEIITRLKKRRVRVVLMTPGIVDDSVKNLKWLKDQTDYNAGGLRAIADEVLGIAKEQKLPVVDLHALMTATLAAAGQAGVDMGPDGIHPDEGGSLIMAHALLQALGVPPREDRIVLEAGTRRSFTVDLPALPYCVDSKARKMLPFLAFGGEFNRVTLAFRGLTGGAWYLRIGEAVTPVFSRDDLERGLELGGMWGIEPLAQAARVAVVTTEKCNTYRQFWRAVGLPDTYIVDAPYDPKPHRMGLEFSGEVEAWRRTLVAPAPLRVELVPAPVAGPLRPGAAITRWLAGQGVDPESRPERTKDEKVALTAPSAALPADWRPVVLDCPDLSAPLHFAYAHPAPGLLSLLATIESGAAQAMLLRLEGAGDFAVYLNGASVAGVKEADTVHDVALAFQAGRNRIMVETWNAQGAVRPFRVVVQSLPSPASLVF
ncbi:MAG: SGNH/GDSL hydrolase family protein [Candidatus Coatesbacteria bacterium]